MIKKVIQYVFLSPFRSPFGAVAAYINNTLSTDTGDTIVTDTGDTIITNEAG